MRDDGEEVVGLRVVHGGGTEDIFADEVDIFLRGGAFEDAAEQRVAVGGVMELRAGLGEERVVGEELEGFFHGGEVAGAVVGDVALAILVVVANAAQVGEKLARSYGRILLGEGRAIFLDGDVQIELAAFIELEDGDCGDRFRDGAEAVERRGGGGSGVFQVGHAEARRPDGLAILNDGNGNAGNAVGGHEGGDGFFDLGALCGGEGRVFFGRKSAGDDDQQGGEYERKWARGLAKDGNSAEHVRTSGARV